MVGRLTRARRAGIVAFALAGLGVAADRGWIGPARAAANDYRRQIEAWRREREQRLKAPGGWLSVVGLYWLEAGETSFGSAPDSRIVLPDGPPHAGRFERRGAHVVVRAAPSAGLTVGGEAVTTRELHADTSGSPEALRVGRLSLSIIERGGLLGVRVRDPESPRRAAFHGLSWFPVREDRRVEARFVAHESAHSISIANVLGQVQEMPSPGYAVFELDGRELRLEPVIEEPDAEELFFIFRDTTAGKYTYPGGRFLYTPLPRDGRVVIDFNKAYSPPCAFTDFATCPLPPPQNRLPVSIEAGEMYATGKAH